MSKQKTDEVTITLSLLQVEKVVREAGRVGDVALDDPPLREDAAGGGAAGAEPYDAGVPARGGVGARRTPPVKG